MSLSFKLLKTEWRAGELPLLFAALLLSVMVVTGLTLFIGRLQFMLAGESSQFLAADRVLSTPRPVQQGWLDEAGRRGLQQARHLQFQSMLYVGDQPQLVSVKAADDPYPLRGELKLRHQPHGSIITTQQGPAPGELWVEGRLFSLLPLKIGDQVYIGDALLTVTAELVSEPDRGAGFMTMGPRVLMHWDDIEKTAVVSEASRLTYSYLFAGTPAQIDDYRQWLLPQLTDSDKWLDLENTQPTIATALNRAERFFLLASSIVVILASLAIAMACLRFSQRHTRQVAVLKTLGATSGRVQGIYLQLLGTVLVLAIATGWLSGWGLQEVVVRQVAASLDVPVPAISAWPFVLGALVAGLALPGFALPPLLQLKQVPAVRIFQLQSDGIGGFTPRGLAFSAAGLLVILALYTREPLLAMLLLASVAGVAGIIALPAGWMLSHLGKTGMQASGWLTLAMSNIRRRLRTNALQTAVFAISLMLLLLIWGIKGTLFLQWQQQLPPKTPNFFLVNIQEGEWQAVNAWLQERQIQSELIYPMVRARLVEINGQAVREFVSKEELSRAGADRELNLSWADQLPPDNTLVEGEWWNDNNSESGVSVEQKLAERLQLKLGDRLTFMSGADTLTATVGSIRQVEWDRMRPNFYMLFTEPQLRDYPKTFMTSIWLPDNEHHRTTELLQAFPTAIVIDIDVMIKQIRRIIGHVSLALEIILVFVIVASLLVMMATVQGTLAQRLRENTVIRALGGTRRLIAGSLLAEFALMGLVAGILATVGAEAVMLVLQYKVFEMPLQLHPELWWIAPVAGTLIIGLAGFASASRVLRVAPMQLLREV